MSVAKRLHALGIALPAPPAAAGAYVPTVQSGELLFTSGQIAVAEGKLIASGTVGGKLDLETGRACAQQCLLNVLAQVQSAIGDLDRVRRVVKLTVFVASAPDFTAQPAVADAASELVHQLFGEAGAHARSTVGVAALPLGSPVEIEAILEIGS